MRSSYANFSRGCFLTKIGHENFANFEDNLDNLVILLHFDNF